MSMRCGFRDAIATTPCIGSTAMATIESTTCTGRILGTVRSRSCCGCESRWREGQHTNRSVGGDGGARLLVLVTVDLA